MKVRNLPYPFLRGQPLKSLSEAHSSLMQFCETFESMYGQLEVTPNMHLHSHLINCVIDYGPVHNSALETNGSQLATD